MDFKTYQVGKQYNDFRGMNGSKLYEQDGRLYLVISYDDLQAEEIVSFRDDPIEITFKTFGLVSIFTFKFGDERIVDAPYNQFAKDKILNPEAYRRGIPLSLTIFIFESSDGQLIGIRTGNIAKAFAVKLAELLKERQITYTEKYNFETFNRGICEIYDNHLLDEVYRLPGDQEIKGKVELKTCYF